MVGASINVQMITIFIFYSGSKLGVFIGKNTVKETKDFYYSDDSCPQFLELYDISPAVQKFIKDYMDVHAIAFPFEHEELVSMAVTMGIKPEYAFMMNGCMELYTLFGGHPEMVANPKITNDPPIFSTLQRKEVNISEEIAHKPKNSDHCSDVGLIYRDPTAPESDNVRVVQGHNEDWWSTVADKMHIIHTPEW